MSPLERRDRLAELRDRIQAVSRKITSGMDFPNECWYIPEQMNIDRAELGRLVDEYNEVSTSKTAA